MAAADGVEVGADGTGHAEFERIGRERVPDRDFLDLWRGREQRRQVVEIEVVARVDAEPRSRRGPRSRCVQRERSALARRTERLCVRLRVELDAIGTDCLRGRHGFRHGVHEETHTHAERTEFRDDRTQAFAVAREVPAVIGRRCAGIIGHQRALLRGTWVPEGTVFLDNRQMNARVGFFVMTPLRLEGGGVILVQRGWVPRNFTDRAALPAVDTPAGLVQIEGRMAPPPSKLYEPGTSSGGAIRQNVDLVQLSAETGLELLPVTLRQTGAASEGMDRQWPAADLGVDKHYGYAFQWFGLSALIAGLYLWFQVIRRFIFRSKDPLRHVQ